MKSRVGTVLTVFSLLFLLSCNRSDISPGRFELLVAQCNDSKLIPWPRDVNVDIYYFPPETNMDDAFDEVSQERYLPSETIELKPSDFDADGNFRLSLGIDQVVILFFDAGGFQADAQLETTHGRSGEICVTYNQ